MHGDWWCVNTTQHNTTNTEHWRSYRNKQCEIPSSVLHSSNSISPIGWFSTVRLVFVNERDLFFGARGNQNLLPGRNIVKIWVASILYHRYTYTVLTQLLAASDVVHFHVWMKSYASCAHTTPTKKPCYEIERTSQLTPTLLNACFVVL